MKAKSGAAHSRQGLEATKESEAGEGGTLRCPNEDALGAARYWYWLARDYPGELTLRGLEQTVVELGPGPEARHFKNVARRLRRDFEKQAHRSLVLTMRTPYVMAFIMAHEDGCPIVRGFVNRTGALCRCPWCGKPERHPVTSDDTQVIVCCERYEGLDYGLQLERPLLLIPAYIPTRGTK